jgi:hypothetical protein
MSEEACLDDHEVRLRTYSGRLRVGPAVMFHSGSVRALLR